MGETGNESVRQLVESLNYLIFTEDKRSKQQSVESLGHKCFLAEIFRLLHGGAEVYATIKRVDILNRDSPLEKCFSTPCSSNKNTKIVHCDVKCL